MYIERRQPDGNWRCLPPLPAPPASERTTTRKNPRTGEEYQYVDPFWGPHGCMYVRDPEPGEDEESQGYLYHWYQNRNYDAFAILSGTVRNGLGFAGRETGSGFRGIVAEPRGLPSDASAIVSKWFTGDHSPGWLMLDEVLAFDWTQVTRKTGVIPMRVQDDRYGADRISFEEWRKSPPTSPKSYSGGISGADVHTVSMVQAHRILDLPHKEHEVETSTSELDLGAFATRGDWRHVTTHHKPRYIPGADKPYWFVQVEWQETYREAALDFLEFAEQLLLPLGNPADTRLVFGFDS